MAVKGRFEAALVLVAWFSLALATAPASAVAAGCAVQVAPVSYRVSLSQDAALPGPAYTVKGFQYSSGGSPMVALLLHGLSYGYWGWDFTAVPSPDPANPYTYSLARYLASRGIDTVAVDELGYGSSDHPAFPDSRRLTIPAYASMAHQIVQTLRRTYSRVVIIGHSAGGEMANYEAGRYRDVDGLIDVAMCDVGASSEVVLDITVNDTEGLASDDGYFGGTPQERTRLMYYLPDADPAVVAADNKSANPTPTAEMQSISPQPARYFDAQVTAPVLVVFGENDSIFPSEPFSGAPPGSPSCQSVQPLLYVASPSVSAVTIPTAGHTVMTHRNASVFEAAIYQWLVAKAGAPSGPACAAVGAVASSSSGSAPGTGSPNPAPSAAALPSTGAAAPSGAPLLVIAPLALSALLTRRLPTGRPRLDALP